MPRSFAVTAVASVLLAVSAAHAAAAPNFASLDKNNDGKLSLDEASADDALFTQFKVLDTDKDGELTQQEFAKYSPT